MLNDAQCVKPVSEKQKEKEKEKRILGQALHISKQRGAARAVMLSMAADALMPQK